MVGTSQPSVGAAPGGRRVGREVAALWSPSHVPHAPDFPSAAPSRPPSIPCSHFLPSFPRFFSGQDG